MHGVATPLTDTARVVEDRTLTVVMGGDADFPVSGEELDVIEAFLFKDLQTLLGDSKEPQSSGTMPMHSQARGRRR